MLVNDIENTTNSLLYNLCGEHVKSYLHTFLVIFGFSRQDVFNVGRHSEREEAIKMASESFNVWNGEQFSRSTR